MPRPASRTLILALTVSLVIFGASCSGGDDGGGGPPVGGQIRAAITAVNTNFLAQFGIVGVTFTITGPPNAIYNTLHQYAPAGSAAFAVASQVPQGLANQVNAQNPGAGVGQILTMNLVLPATDGGSEVTSLPMTFWWYAYADLGFIGGNFSFQILPNSQGLIGIPSPIGSGDVPYPGAPTQTVNPSGGTGAGDPGSTGAPPTSTGGRGGHTATHTRGGPTPKSSGLNILVAGGYTSATSPNAFDSMDRFAFDSNAFTHSIPFSGAMVAGPVRRVLHASAFFIDPTNGAIKVLTTGGVDDCDPSQAGIAGQVANATAEEATGNVYCFSPVEQVTAVTNSMTSSRFDHAACWVPCNEVVIIGGCTNTGNPTALATIEHYRPDQNDFAVPLNSFGQPATLGAGMERCGHECALMADGRVFIAGGYNPASMTPMPCLIYDPISHDTTVAAGGSTQIMVRNHTATRMANGWILIVGGSNPSTGFLSNNAYVYKPESDTFDVITCQEAREMHQATLLGDKNVLITGGITSSGGVTGYTTSAQVFTVDNSYTAGFTSITIFDALNEARADHTATATDCGGVFVIGGRNDVGGGINFLDSIEFFSFSNDVPIVTQAMTSTSSKPSGLGGTSGTVNIDVDVTDAEQDGGYVIIRYRTVPAGDFCTATIICQTPSTSTVTDYPNMMVSPGSYTFTWDYPADGINPGELVEIEIIPVGAIIGSPLRFMAEPQ